MNLFFQYLRTSPKSRKSFLFSLILLGLTAAQGAFAFNVCLYARSNNNPTNGHSFVTIEDEAGKVLETYGYWPKEKYPSYVTVNLFTDNPIRVIKARGGGVLSERLKQMTEERLCQQVDGVSIAQIREAAVNYPKTHGPYRLLTNNCTHFAIGLYNAATRDKFPLRQQPLEARRIIKQIRDAGATSYLQYKSIVRR